MDARVLRLDPLAANWMLGISWKFDVVIYRLVRLYGLAVKARFSRPMDALGFDTPPTLGGARREYDEVFAKR